MEAENKRPNPFVKLLKVIAGLSVLLLFVYKNFEDKDAWNEFLKPPEPLLATSLKEATPLERTDEVDKSRGTQQYEDQPEDNFIFSDICKMVQKSAKATTPAVVEKEVKKETIIVKKPVSSSPVRRSLPLKKKKKKSGIFSKRCQPINTEINKNFLCGFVAGTQDIKPGRSLKIIITDPFVHRGRTIPKGAYLFGLVTYSHERVLVNFKTAVFGKNTIPVNIDLYDTDYARGIVVADLEPFMESSKDRLMNKAAHTSSNGWVKEIGSTAIEALNSNKKAKKVVVENKRKVLLQLIIEEKRR